METLSKSMMASPEQVIAPTSSSNQIKDFFNSNNFIAKISFLFLVIFVVIVLFQLVMRFFIRMYSPPKTVKLIDGVINASQMKIINQDITQSPSMLVTPSSNKKEGIEFTWSVWIFINSVDQIQDPNVRNLYHNVFFKGIYHPYNGLDPNCNKINTTSNAPGLYIIYDASTTNSVVAQVLMDTYTQPSTDISIGTTTNDCNIPNPLNIPHIPLNVWVNIVIRCKGNDLDAYVNGTIANSVTLVGVPKQNYGDVYVAANGGFNGNIASLIYMNHGASNEEIWNIYKKGPSKKMLDSSFTDVTKTNYLSFGWYLTN